MSEYEHEKETERRDTLDDSKQHHIYLSFLPLNWFNIPRQGLFYFLSYAEYDGTCL